MIVKTTRRMTEYTFVHTSGQEFRAFAETWAIARASVKHQARAAGLRATDEDFLVK